MVSGRPYFFGLPVPAGSLKLLGLLTACVLHAAPPSPGTIHVQVAFRNGDLLSGTLISADANSVQLSPEITALGASVSTQWAADGIAELRLTGAAGQSPACLYTVGGPSIRQPVCFKSAVLAVGTSGKQLRLVAKRYVTKPAAGPPRPAADEVIASIQSVSGQPIGAPVAVAAPPPAEAAPTGAGHPISVWNLNLNAPESVVQGTQSQQVFGALLVHDLYFGDHNHFMISASGTHQHSLSVGKPGTRTDYFDSTAQIGHSFGEANGKRIGIYAVGDWFFNTSLGMAAERSVGSGVVLPQYRSKSENVQAKLWADLRYFNERLYNGRKLNLFGSTINGELNYSPSSQSWFFTAGFTYTPMSDRSAWQGYGNMTLSLPLGNHVCVGLTPVDDSYIENSPRGFRRNYLKSSASLKLQLGNNPGQKCK